MFFDPGFADLRLKPLSLGVPGLRWDPVARKYVDGDGRAFELKTE